MKFLRVDVARSIGGPFVLPDIDDEPGRAPTSVLVNTDAIAFVYQLDAEDGGCVRIHLKGGGALHCFGTMRDFADYLDMSAT